MAEKLMNDSDKDGLIDFIRMTRMLFHYEYLESRDRLKLNFELVTAAQDDNETLVNVTEAQLSPSEFHSLSVDFVGDFCSLLADANYSLLTQKEWEVAMAENFMFNLPCDIAWDKFDKNLLSSFLKQNPALSQGLPQFADSALLFKRGNGTAVAKGMFIQQKVEMLIDMALVEPFLWLIGKPRVVIASMDGYAVPGAKEKRHDVSTVERKTLRRLLPTPFAVLKSFFSTMELQEPTFKELVILYRMDKPEGDQKAAVGGAGPLVIKSFHDVPMADVEMVFPEVRITVKFLDMLINVTLMIVAVFTFIGTLMGSIVWSTQTISIISMLCGKVAQSIFALMNKQVRYTAMMANQLKSKSSNSQIGLLMHTMESMEDQECKEMILSYSILTAHGKSMTLKEIDTACEALMHDHFGLNVDFDVEGAIVKLLRERLVEQTSGVLYTATPLKKALQRLDKKWDNLFNYRDTAKKLDKKDKKETEARAGYQNAEATLQQNLANSDRDRAKVVSRLKEQQDEISKRIKELEEKMTGYKWRTG